MALSERLALWARWPAKSSVQSWFSGSRPCSSRYSAHLERRPVPVRERRAAVDLREAGHAQQHVAALLDRHLALLGLLAAAVDLTVGERVRAEVVRREREFPGRRGGERQDRLELGLQEGGIEKEKEGAGRIEHVDRAHAAVARVLLREVQEASIVVAHQRMAAEALAKGKAHELRVDDPAARFRLLPQVGIEPGAALEQRLPLRPRPLDQAKRAAGALVPERPQAPGKVLDRKRLVVGDQKRRRHRLPADAARRSARGHDDERRPPLLETLLVRPRHGRRRRRHAQAIAKTDIVARLDASRPGELAAQRLAFADCACARLPRRGREMQPAPVDADLVAGPLEHGLAFRADPERLDLAGAMPAPDDPLLRHGDGPHRRDVEVEAHLVLTPVERTDGAGKIGHRPGENVQIVGQCWRGETECELDACGLENIVCAGRQHVDARLPHGGNLDLRKRRVPADEAERAAIDPGDAGHRPRLSRPVDRPLSGQLIGCRPYAEVGVVDHERHRGRAPGWGRGHGGSPSSDWGLAAISAWDRGRRSRGRPRVAAWARDRRSRARSAPARCR